MLPCPAPASESVQSDLLHKYQSRDILILCVRLAVIVAVILTVPVLFFTVSGRPRASTCPRALSREQLCGDFPASLKLHQGQVPDVASKSERVGSLRWGASSF